MEFKIILCCLIICKALYTRARRLRTASFTCGVWLINFLRTCGEQRTPGAWRRIQFSLCSHKKPTNFGLRRMVWEPFADSAAQVHSPIHTYTHLVREPFDVLVYTRLKRSFNKRYTCGLGLLVFSVYINWKTIFYLIYFISVVLLNSSCNFMPNFLFYFFLQKWESFIKLYQIFILKII